MNTGRKLLFWIIVLSLTLLIQKPCLALRIQFLEPDIRREDIEILPMSSELCDLDRIVVKINDVPEGYDRVELYVISNDMFVESYQIYSRDDFEKEIDLSSLSGLIELRAFVDDYSDHLLFNIDRDIPTFTEISHLGGSAHWAKSPVQLYCEGISDDSCVYYSCESLYSSFQVDEEGWRDFSGTSGSIEMSEGSHIIRAILRDECGRYSEEVSTELWVDNTPPNVSFINPTPEEYEAIEFQSDITIAIAAYDPSPMDDSSLLIRDSASGLSRVIIYRLNDIGDPDGSPWEELCRFTGPWYRGLANRAECDINVDLCCGHYRLRAVAYDRVGNQASAERIINIVLPDPEPFSGGGGGFSPPYSPFIPMPFPPLSYPAFSSPQFPYFSPSGLGTGGIPGFGLGFNQGLSSNFGIGRGSLILGNMSFAAPQGLAFGGGLTGWTTPMFGAGFSLGSPSTFGIGGGNSIIGNLPITTPQNPNFGGAFSSLTTPILGAGFNPVSVSNYGGNQFVWDSSFMGLQGSTLGGAPSSLTLLPLGAEGFVPLNSISPAL